ncbi:MAG: EamA family transporter, partial [Candidatus Roizmanbacteria bacterium]
MLSYGIAFFLLARTSKSIGALRSTFIFQLVGIPFFIFAFPFGQVPSISLNYLAPVLVGIADAFVYIVFLHALKVGKVSIVSPIIDTYALFTFILGAVFLHESVVPMKVIGSILIVLGLVF